MYIDVKQDVKKIKKKRSAARTKIPAISEVMAELEDEARAPQDSTALPVRSVDASRGRGHGRGNANMRGRRRGPYASGQGKSSEVCSHCHTPGHGETNCWKKYPEKSPNSQKKTEQQKKTDSSRFTGNGKKDGTSFNLASRGPGAH